MNVPRTSRMALVCLLTLGIVARAADPDNRTYWRHKDNKGGHWEKLEGKNWVERSGPKKFFDFVEKARNDKYIEIYDPKRHITLRLYDDRVEKGGGSKWTKLYDGLWVLRRAAPSSGGGRILGPENRRRRSPKMFRPPLASAQGLRSTPAPDSQRSSQ